MKPQLCSPLGRILVLIFGLFASAASPFRADAATCTTSDLASGSAAFVAHSTGTTTSGSVFLVNVNASPNTVQCSMTVGKDPTNLAVSPDGSLLFVENDADGTVTVLNLTDGTLNKTITLTGAPMTANLAVSPDNSKVYVVTLPSPLPATPPAASLYVISLPSLGVSAAIPVTAPATPTPPVSAPGLGVAFSPDATLAFIATEGLTYIVTTASNAVSATSIPANGGTAAVQPSGSFAYVVDVAANPTTVAQFAVSASPPAPVIQTPSPQCTGANATAITPDSSLVYYTCPGTNFVQSITAATNTCPGTGCTTILLGPASTGPQGLAVTPDGTSVYVANSDGSISVVSVSGNAVAATISGTAPLRGIGFRLPIVAFISPAPPATTENVPVNATFPFSAGAKFTKNPATVSWSVTCAAGGAAFGSIDPVTGIYTAPATPPSPPTVTVTATSNSTEFLFNPRFSSASVTVTVTAPAIIVSVVPASSTVGIDLTDTITATAQNDTSGQGVTGWAVNGTLGGDANVGTVVATDATHATYTAPQVLPLAPSMVSVTATSVADGTQTGSATLTITSNVTVTVAPVNPTLSVNSQTKFTATVSGDTANLGVTWSLGACPVAPTTTPPNPTPCGTLTPIDGLNVFYNAPPVVQPNSPLVTITAKSVADTSQTGTSGITINSNVTVTVAPPNPTLGINSQTKFTATVSGDTANLGVTWSLGACPITPTTTPSNPTPCGTLTPIDGLNVFYNAPPVVQPNSPLVTITAKSVADTSKPGGNSAITINSNVTVTVAPVNPTLGINTQTKFTATVLGDTSNFGVTWSIACTATPTTTPANPNPCGTLAPIDGFNVFYNAPPVVQPNPPQVTITAKSVADTSKTGNSAITINSNVMITVAPVNPTLGINTQTKFTATVQNDPNNLGVTWSLGACPIAPTTNPSNPTPCGTLTPIDGFNVFYNAPPVVQPNAPLITIIGTSVADTSKTGNSAIAINSNVTVTVAPVNPTLGINTQTKFTATVLGDASNFGVTWSIACAATPTTTPANPNPCGTLTAIDNFNVFYNAPPVVQPNPPQVTITAKSVADTSKTGTSALTINSNVSVSVAPVNPTLGINTQTKFTATVLGDASNFGVTWSIACAATPTTTPANPNPCGTLTAIDNFNVFYNAPPVVQPNPPQVTITAKSVADTSKTGTSALTINSNVSVSVAIVSASIPAPATGTVAIGFSVSFAAAVTGDSSSFGVKGWSVNGVVGGNSTVGKIVATDLTHATYTAPTAVPSPAAVNVTATSVADFTKTSPSSSIQVVSDQLVYDPANPTGKVNVPAAPATSGSVVIDLQGPPNIPVSAFSCTDLDKLNGKATCTFALNPTPNLITCPATQCTSVTLTLSVVRASAALVGPGSFPPLKDRKSVV